MSAPRFVRSTSGVDLAVRETGPSEAPTLILVHGFPDDHRVWDGVVARLADRYHVVTYDTRGAGDSSAPSERADYRLEALATDLAAVIEATSPHRAAHVIGHDWGGIQSWEAVTDESIAKRIASFTTIAGPCLDHVAHWMRRASASAFVGQAVRSWYVAMFQLPHVPELVWRRHLVGAWPGVLRRREQVRGEIAPVATETVIHGLELYRANMIERLRAPRRRAARIPVQIIAPKGDHYVSPAVTKSALGWGEDLFHREVTGGHWIVRTHPDRVARWIEDLVLHAEGRSDPPSLMRARPARDTAHRHERKVVVVTGGASGIGRATALAFAERGAELVIADVDRQGADETARGCERLGAKAAARVVDVSDASAMESFAASVEHDFGAPDVVVNNAGIGIAGKLLDTSVADWERILGVNLWGVLHGCRLFGAQMVARGQGGHIVNIASAAAFVPSVTLPAYATTKVAVRMLSECLRAELASEGIGVSAICPGLIDTPITRRTTFVGVSAEEQDRRRQASAQLYRRRGFGPEQVAEAIVDAVERDLSVVPVSIEAHAMDVLGRYAPSVARAFAKIDFTAR